MRQRLVYILATGWVAAIILSFVHPRFIAPTGDSFTRGLNRLGAVMGWQALALFLAFILAIIVIGIVKPRTWLLRIAGFGPIIISGAAVLLVVGSLLWARFSKPAPVSVPAPGTVTAPLESLPTKPTTTN